MIIFDYGTLLSPSPIKLSIGTIRKPKLKEIAEISFNAFSYYEAFLKSTPKIIYTELLGENGKAYWDSLSEDEQDSMSLYDVILNNVQIQNIYQEVLGFFFEETVVFQNGIFLLLKEKPESPDDVRPENIRGIITGDTFQDILEIIQQTCSIYEKPKQSPDKMNFKNAIARKLYERMMKAQEEQERLRAKKTSKDHSLPNVISSVSNSHPSINPISIWDMTVFQLIDSFNRLQVNEVYGINKTRVSVWGDEKKTFDSTLWYKNSFDSE